MPALPTSPSTEPPVRRDAQRNRRALVEAARAVFGERGLDAPLDEIARRAGIGNATLYRHFPTRCTLIAAVFVDTLEDVVHAADQALSDPSPWDGFAGHVEFLCRLQATDRGLADLLTTTVTGDPRLEELRARALRDVVLLADRAKAAGELRDDFAPEDLALLLMANAGLVHRASAAAPTAWRRMLSFTLDGLRAGAGVTAAAPSPGESSVARAMADQAARFGCG